MPFLPSPTSRTAAAATSAASTGVANWSDGRRSTIGSSPLTLFFVAKDAGDKVLPARLLAVDVGDAEDERLERGVGERGRLRLELVLAVHRERRRRRLLGVGARGAIEHIVGRHVDESRPVSLQSAIMFFVASTLCTFDSFGEVSHSSTLVIAAQCTTTFGPKCFVIEVAAVGEVGAVEVDGVVGGEGLVGRDHLVAGLLEGQRAAPSDEAAATGDENALEGILGMQERSAGRPPVRYGRTAASRPHLASQACVWLLRRRANASARALRARGLVSSPGYGLACWPGAARGRGRERERGKELGLFRLGGADPKRRKPSAASRGRRPARGQTQRWRPSHPHQKRC